MNASLALRIQLKIIFGSFYLNLTFQNILRISSMKKKILAAFYYYRDMAFYRSHKWVHINTQFTVYSTKKVYSTAGAESLEKANCFFYNLCYTISIYVILYLPIGQPIHSYLFLSFQINNFWNFYNTFSSFFFFFQRSKSWISQPLINQS